ncbi:hypothetical protein UFOVP594_7 [uncultured Caudovirales phage]|uniref:Uncharacterized protein n=1 Tax=uncultured Caudovirales phage TaxID=2100421 RepID=A0A6J5N6D0_9CAUD|nr:hypothetical protein UFOVP594_7 [uncultured Caudovirales phage]
MTTESIPEMQIPEDTHSVVVSKNGLVFYLNKARADKCAEMIDDKAVHHLIIDGQNLNKIGLEILTIDRYVEMTKIKNGYRKCAYGKWHNKNETCMCHSDALARVRQQEQAKRDRTEYGEKSPEQMTALLTKAREVRQQLEADHIVPPRRDR